MNIVLLNGNPASGPLDGYLDAWKSGAERAGHTVSVFELRSLQMPRCTGCFGCWLKTPGQCVSKDASHDISRAAVAADLVVFAAPVFMGFTGFLLKNALDKLIQILHPYVEIAEGEIHHRKRYRKYPGFALLLERGPDTDDEDMDIIETVYRRAALNFKSEPAWTATTDRSIEEVLHALC